MAVFQPMLPPLHRRYALARCVLLAVGVVLTGCGGSKSSAMGRTIALKHGNATELETIAFGEELKVHRYQLHNGLRVAVLEDPSAPVVSYHTWFRVGSRHEKPGKTGLAHLFEHLMFNEVEGLPAGAFDRLIEEAGGDSNAATWVDWTFYYENIPKEALEQVMHLEATRMSKLVLRDPQVTSEKEVVANERRYRVEDDVEGYVNEQLYATAFHDHPYHWPTIGWMKDIEGFTTQDCLAFYRTYYAPNNATLVVTGDVKRDAVLAQVDAHYGALKPAEIPKDNGAVEPPQSAERRRELVHSTPTEKLALGYRGPAMTEYDHVVLSVAAQILFGGRSSRLYRSLVSEGRLASDARGSIAPLQQPGLFEVWVSMREGRHAEEALAVVEHEFARLAKEGPRPDELTKVKNSLELQFFQGLDTAGGKAEQIGFYETVTGSPEALFQRLDDVRRVTASEIKAAVAKYLVPPQRTTLLVRPSPEGQGASAEAER